MGCNRASALAALLSIWTPSPATAAEAPRIPLMEGWGGAFFDRDTRPSGDDRGSQAAGGLVFGGQVCALCTFLAGSPVRVGELLRTDVGIGYQSGVSGMNNVTGAVGFTFSLALGFQTQVQLSTIGLPPELEVGLRYLFVGQMHSAWNTKNDDDHYLIQPGLRYGPFIGEVAFRSDVLPFLGRTQNDSSLVVATARYVFDVPWFAGIEYHQLDAHEPGATKGIETALALRLLFGAQY